jgi:hypothetical protein
MKKIFSSIALVLIISACKKDFSESLKADQSQSELQTKKPTPPPPANANPVFAFEDIKKISNQLSVFAIYVMDVDGANRTSVYTNYSGNGNNVTINNPDYPAWSADGTKLCFTLNSVDLYTLDISVVNGVPTGSNATKIGDGVAGGGSYKQGKWRPGQNQIACVWKKTGVSDQINLLPSTGGSPTVLYTAASTDWVIENDIAFKSDGSNLLFSERQLSTGNVYLNVLDVSNGQVTKSIDMSQFSSIVHVDRIAELDWGKSSGSNTVAITTRPQCDGSHIGLTGIHQLFTLDVSATSPALTWIMDDVGNISYSSDDSKITIPNGLGRINGGGCSISSYNAMRIYTFNPSGITSPSYTGGNHHDWKR